MSGLRHSNQLEKYYEQSSKSTSMGASQASAYNRKWNDPQMPPTHTFRLELAPMACSADVFNLRKNFFWYGDPKDLVLPH